MTQKEKDILLKDLCSRLPYGVNVATPYGTGLLTSIRINDSVEKLGVNIDPVLIRIFSADDVKPYLFPMSSMTEEQNLEYLRTCMGGNAGVPTLASFEWCDKNHFDYRGLIPMGLVEDATGKNIY